MVVKIAFLRIIIDNSGIIGAIFLCTTVVARNMIIISVVIVAAISLFIIRYDSGYAIVIIVVIGIIMVDIMVMVMTIVVVDHCPCFLT